MNLRELIDVFRDEVGDKRKPYLVSDERATRLFNQAESEAARRARLLTDTTNSMCRITVAAGDPVVRLDPRIIGVRRARMAASSIPLRLIKVRDADEHFSGWDASEQRSVPMFAITDGDSGSLRLYPLPSADGELLLSVTRDPLRPMRDDDDCPEIAPRLHAGLVEWVKFRVYSDDDSELFDASKAQKALQAFEEEFGGKSSALNEQFELENYHGIGEF